MTPPQELGALSAQLSALGAFLREHRLLWRSRPFIELPAPWESQHDEIAGWARSLDSEAVEAFERAADESREPPGPLFEPPAGVSAPPSPPALHALAEQARELSRVPALSRRALAADTRGRLSWRVPGRKRAQIEALCAALLDPLEACGVGAVVDWCAGKGHLGRTLSALGGVEALCVEHDAALCERGAALARDAAKLIASRGDRAARDKIGASGEARGDGAVATRARYAGLHAPRCRFVAASVFDAPARALLSPGRAAVGLHACGDLGVELLRRAVDGGADLVALAPCCYHRRPEGEDGTYLPLSRAARADDVGLGQPGLRLPAAEEVVARAGVRSLRRRELRYRLAFELLRAQASAESGAAHRYHPLPPLPPRWFRLPLRSFCEEAAQLEGGTRLPARWDEGEVERRAARRLTTARALGLVRAVFRRPLEAWLVLDRALFLAEQGYAARVGTFCSRELTPRNLLVLGQRA